MQQFKDAKQPAPMIAVTSHGWKNETLVGQTLVTSKGNSAQVGGLIGKAGAVGYNRIAETGSRHTSFQYFTQ